MPGLLHRFLAGALAGVIGGLIGLLLGHERGAVLGAVLGALLGFVGVILFDALRGWRLLRWLRGGSLATTAPRDSGFWGELGYRIERGLRALEREAELERTNLTQFFAAMEASPNGVLLLDANDQIEWCNSRAADHFGLDPERDRRQRVTNLIRSPAFVAYLQAGNFDEPIAVRDSRTPGSLQVTIRRYGAGAKLVLSQDLTERERSDAMRRDFVANVSHEIRTPLTVLSGFLETMRNLPLTEVEQKRVLMLMTQQAERMGNLVGDLLTLAQLEGSPRPTGDKWVRVASLFGQVEAQVRALSAGRHTIVFGDPGEARIAGNESELLSAVGNLANNAVRYTPDGGRIEVGWQRNDNGTGELFVTDTGRGIAREHLSRLTERFFRSDRSRATRGTGLGLAIVKHIITAADGTAEVEGAPGEGTRFRFVLPAPRSARII